MSVFGEFEVAMTILRDDNECPWEILGLSILQPSSSTTTTTSSSSIITSSSSSSSVGWKGEEKIKKMEEERERERKRKKVERERGKRDVNAISQMQSNRLKCLLQHRVKDCPEVFFFFFSFISFLFKFF